MTVVSSKVKMNRHWRPSMALDDLYSALNTRLFESKLPTVPCYINPRLKRVYGRCFSRFNRGQSKGETVAIDIAAHSLGGELFDTLIHEMVHVWQVNMGYRPIHDKRFWSTLKTKMAAFKMAVEAGELSSTPPDFPPGVVQVLDRRKANVPKKYWVLDLKLNAEFDFLNQKYFDNAFPKVQVYLNHRLSRSICRCHFGKDESGRTVPLAFDVSPIPPMSVTRRGLRLTMKRVLKRLDLPRE